MIFGLCFLGIILILWFLLIEGALWKIIVLISSWFGMFFLLESFVPETKQICLNFNGYDISWSQLIPSIIVILAMMYTKES